jgi:hypothetical protein
MNEPTKTTIVKPKVPAINKQAFHGLDISKLKVLFHSIIL